MSHLKDCLVESPSLAGNADGENEVEGVKVKNTKNTTLGKICKALKRQKLNMILLENYKGSDLYACKTWSVKFCKMKCCGQTRDVKNG